MIGTVHGLQALLDIGVIGSQSDGQLLDRFLARREEAVFGAIVDRHGPMVWGVCRRILRDHHDAEDAFQAAFLVLARRASVVSPREDLGNWLHGVALRTALKARATRAKRMAREVSGLDAPEPSATPPEPRDVLAEALDRELNRLPEKYRTPIVLCDLEGRTHAEAADRLGWPIGTVSGRLSRARSMLAKRLVRRGAGLAVGSLVAGLAREAVSATLPASRIAPVLKTACLTGRTSVAGLVSTEVITLSREVQGGILMAKLKATAAALLAAGVLATGLAVLAQGEDGAASATEGPTRQASPSRKPAGGNSIVEAYYIGDLIFADPTKSRVDGDPQVDMSPLIEMITTSIAPGSWKVNSQDDGGIAPFRPSFSLIIHREPEVHEQVAALLRGLRRYQEDLSAAIGVTGRLFPRTYAVGDLLRSPDDAPDSPGRLDRDDLIKRISSMISARPWTPDGRSGCSVVPGPDDTLDVWHTPVGHAQVEKLLTGLRRSRDSRKEPTAAR